MGERYSTLVKVELSLACFIVNCACYLHTLAEFVDALIRVITGYNHGILQLLTARRCKHKGAEKVVFIQSTPLNPPSKSTVTS